MSARASWLRRLDPAAWSPRAQVLALFLPAIALVASAAGAALAPDRYVLTHIVKALLLMAPRWCMAMWPLWAMLLGWRAPRLRPPAVVLGLFGLATAGWPETDRTLDAPGWTVVSTNVNSYSPEPDTRALEAELLALDPDVVLVIEKRLLALAGYRRVDNFDDPLPRPSHGTAVFCKDGVDCAAEVTEEFGSETMKMPLALVRLGGDLCLLGVHSPPPVPFDPSGIGPYIGRIAEAVEGGRMARDWAPCRAGDPIVLVGDLNAPPRSTAYRALVDGEGLRDTRARTGVYGATWPAGGGWPDLPYFRLDHLLAGDVEITEVYARRMSGADHKALVFRARP